MWSVFRKEWTGFLSSLIGYMAIGAFLVLLGLILFVFPDTSLLNYPYATLDQLFELAPWVFLLLIPAVTMRSIAEEQQTRTMELLRTKPLSLWAIVGGKYLASFALALLALVPTLLYYYTVWELGSPRGNLDAGAIAGSYLGLALLSATFCAVGVLTSALAQNQIVAFILAALGCFFLHFGFAYLSALPVFVAGLDHVVQQFGMQYHYRSLARGLIELRDVIYFLSVTLWLLFSTVLILRNRTV